MEEKVVPLSYLDEGDEGTVTHIEGGRGFVSRLASMGVVPGGKIRVLRNKAGLLIILSSNTRLAMGRGQAGRILVRKMEMERELPEKEIEKREILVALAGQPNVGKSTIFNILTGLSQHVGNWPGKTVERKEGIYTSEECNIRIVDLPGTYSLSSFSEEERIARDFIIHEHPDIVVLVANAATLERSLYLLSELFLFKRPVIVVLNMIDVAESQGIHIDVNELQNHLKVPVVPAIATKNFGIKELVGEILKAVRHERFFNPEIPHVSKDHEEIYNKIKVLVSDHINPPYTDLYVTTKLMEGDPEVADIVKDLVPVSVWNEIQSYLMAHEDTLRAVVGGRYDWIERIKRKAVSEFKRGEFLITDRLDHILTHPFFGTLTLIAILGVVFLFTFKIGLPLQGLLEDLIKAVGEMAGSFLEKTPLFVRGLLVEALIGGVGSVITLIPLLFVFFFVIGFLEDVGYMARVAFVMDRIMHLIGLHGKSFLPLCIGIGCNVPSVLGSRIIESRRARLLTVFLTPFVPCTGRLSVLILMTTILFSENAIFVSWLLVSINILLLFLTGLFIKIFLLRGEAVPFVMELPLYHKPNMKTILITLLVRISEFMKKAGTVIFLFSVVLWFVSHFPRGSGESVLERFGYIISPIGRPLGLDWKITTALVSGFVAKENVIATLGILLNAGENSLKEILPQIMSPCSALAFLCMFMLFIPCVATTFVMRQEMKNRRWFLSSLIYMFFLAYFLGIVVYNISRWFFPNCLF